MSDPTAPTADDGTVAWFLKTVGGGVPVTSTASHNRWVLGKSRVVFRHLDPDDPGVSAVNPGMFFGDASKGEGETP